MKKLFEEPKIFVERFTVTDQTMTVSWVSVDPNSDETNAFGIEAITPG